MTNHEDVFFFFFRLYWNISMRSLITGLLNTLISINKSIKSLELIESTALK